MGVKTVQHKEHSHKVKVINEEIFGLKINDEQANTVHDAFGWVIEKYDLFLITYLKYLRAEEAMRELYKDIPEATKTSSLVDFLKSNAFKQLQIKIQTPNDYFMLGFIFSTAIMSKDMTDMGDILKMLREKLK